MFISVIHNNQNLDHVQILLHYLKGYLSGEAEQLLRQIPIMQENYERCWNLFESRYQNKNFLRHNILKRLLKNLFSESASGLKEIVETTTDCLNVLMNQGVDVSSWDIIIIHIITSKLDWETRKQWGHHFANSTDELPTI